MVNTHPRGGGLSETLAFCSNNVQNWIRTSIICYHLREAAHWNDSPVDEDRLYPRHRRPPLYRWWSSFILSRHNCHQNNLCHHFALFSHLPRAFNWLVSECFLEAPIPKLVFFRNRLARARRKAWPCLGTTTLREAIDPSAPPPPRPPWAQPRQRPQVRTWFKASTSWSRWGKKLGQLRGCDDHSQVAAQMSMIGGQIHFRGALVQVLSCHHFSLDRLI